MVAGTFRLLFLEMDLIEKPSIFVKLGTTDEVLLPTAFNPECLKGTLMQIWKSANIFVFIWT